MPIGGGPGAQRELLSRGLVSLGATLLVLAVGAKLVGEVGKESALRSFRDALAAAGTSSPDTRLWSPERVRGFEESLRRELGAPLAVLSIPSIGLEVPVLAGTDDLTLNRGVGLIEGTPRPDQGGNAGIAGHRDGFFRGLKDVAAGAEVRVETLSGTRVYVVDWIRIVPPEEVQVLAPTPEAALTLVTCYPFYFVGNAPQRFIVRATLRPGAPAASAPGPEQRRESPAETR